MPAKSHKKIVIILSTFAFGMLLFAFALVPLYNVLCKSFGINGKTSGAAVAKSKEIDNTRTVNVMFVTSLNENMPWTFYPKTRKITVHPGENKLVVFFGRNDTNHPMTIQAIPSISPGLGAKYFKKTQCFCFTQHTLGGKKSMDMPLLFHIDPHLPKDIHDITLSYTLFDLTKFNSAKHSKTQTRS